MDVIILASTIICMLLASFRVLPKMCYVLVLETVGHSFSFITQYVYYAVL